MDIVHGAEMKPSVSLINKIYGAFSDGVHFAAPISFLRTCEVDLVRGVLHILQGLSSSLFYWDNVRLTYLAKTGIYVTHLSQKSLHVILNQFMYAATCLRLVEVVVNKVEKSVRLQSPTLRAFSCSVSAWLKRLRDVALKEEVNISNFDGVSSPTLLGLASSLSSLCSGADFLQQIVHGAIPKVYLETGSSVPATEIAVHILDHLYKKLNEICPVQGGEEDAYRMLLYIFVGSLLPYIEGLDSWLFEGTLDDPFEEMFFYANKAVSVKEADFWEKSYLLRQRRYEILKVSGTPTCIPLTDDKKEVAGRESISVSSPIKGKDQNNREIQVCPLFIKEIATEIVSAGKSLQLIQHAPMMFLRGSGRGANDEVGNCRSVSSNNVPSKTGLTLSEVFCLSLTGLIGHGDHISKYFLQEEPFNSKIAPLIRPFVDIEKLEGGNGENLPAITCSEKVWYKFLVDMKDKSSDAGEVDKFSFKKSFCPENPVITVCQNSLDENKDAWSALNLSSNFYLPPLNDEGLRNAIFGGKREPFCTAKGTNYTSGFQFGESGPQDDTKMLEVLFPFPTLLPPLQEELYISEFLPFQKNSSLPSRVLNWIQRVEPKTTPLPVVILQECLVIYIKKQVDYVGRNILSKLLNEWRLMDELGVLRAIYLLGSGDLLQHFLTVIFDKLDKGESWDDDFELNMLLQESIANSADGMLLSAPDSLVVSISKNHGFSADEEMNAATLVSTPRKSRGKSFGIDGLDLLNFAYKVSWPLELIFNMESIKKYNQVMSFLLKVKRAKFVLDKTRRWMWKVSLSLSLSLSLLCVCARASGRGTATINRKRHWLVEQKLLHFVDAFHQYVMDRVYHSAWRELCEGMASASSLDEVIEVHEAYLLSIQRQCFVVPDKLWALIASRINSILGLALDFYSVQQTLTSGGAVSAIKARCEMEVARIEKQFDDCIAFLLRVLSFKLNVGHFPHLADLVTRINYNYFYMSYNGNLITAPGSETLSSKMGKAYAVRTD
ncbi:hypothetical protein RHSIM_Rhsim13G0049200 [Rhododendron simsii]|uniref:Gamma-tubulin complex component n=1 Tax=Rhododendron simsii TaxID=118357 RepID=A0A834G0E4_RHOSS|nr:hypothetical protein RHSIM_Rhsim13G0049200 [Rhododendron simsii]